MNQADLFSKEHLAAAAAAAEEEALEEAYMQSLIAQEDERIERMERIERARDAEFNAAMKAAEEEALAKKRAKNGGFELVSMDDLETLTRAVDTRDADMKPAVRVVLQKLLKDNVGTLAKWPQDIADHLSKLADDFPNMIEVLNLVGAQSVLASIGDDVFSLPPILLLGEPGVGKTEFAQRLAELVGTRVLKIDMSAAQSDMLLNGSDKRWANSQVGEIANCLIFSDVANPIVLMDELDKANDVRGGNPAKALLQLLEKRTATEFRDACLPELRLNASKLVWIALANNKEDIPAPVLSRFICFEIENPNEKQSIVIAASIYRSLRKANAWGKAFAEEPTEEVVIACAKIGNPRSMRIALEAAFANAALDRRNHLIVDDIEIRKESKKRRIGF